MSIQVVIMFGDEPIAIPANSTDDVSILRETVHAITAISPAQQILIHNGRQLPFSGSLSSLSIADGDILIVNASSGGAMRKMHLSDVPADISAEALIQMTKEHTNILAQLSSADPELHVLVAAEDIPKIRALMMKRRMQNHKAKFERKVLEDKIWADPDNEENQKIIAERIRLENVQQNMETAMEELPEGFGSVIMLYVDVEINGHPVKAFVDSGAQSTIMSVLCAERCGVMKLLDKRFAGEARGVGTAKILGRVHIVQMKFGNSFFPVSLTVLDQNDVDFLFGLDMLKRHRCEISLRDNELRIEGGSGTERVQFLSEGDIGKSFGKSKPTDESYSNESSSALSGGGGLVSAPSDVDPEKLMLLEALGFSEEQSRKALERTEGDVDLAATLLSTNSL